MRKSRPIKKCLIATRNGSRGSPAEKKKKALKNQGNPRIFEVPARSKEGQAVVEMSVEINFLPCDQREENFDGKVTLITLFTRNYIIFIEL